MDLGLGGLFSSSPGIVERITVASSTSKVSIASSLGSGAFLWPPRVGFSASAGFSASTGLPTFLAPRLKFFVYFRDLVLDLERSLSPDLDLERLLERSF